MAVNVGTAIAYLNLDATNFNTGLANAQSALSNLQSGTGSLMQTVAAGGTVMANAGTAWTRTFTAPLVNAAKETITFGADFEKAMSNVESVMKSVLKPGDMDRLRDAAMYWGQETVYTATEAAEALFYMGQAGWDVDQALNGLPAILNLAAAGNLDLGRASDIVTDSMTAMNLTAGQVTNGIENTAYYTSVLAAVSANANTDVNKLGESFKYVAPTAGQLNYTIEDLAIALGLAANAGIKSSQAGTSLRQALKQLIDPTDKTQAAMDKYGISLFDATGKAYPLRDVILQLQRTFGDLGIEVLDTNGDIKEGESIMEEYGNSLPISQQEKLQAIVQLFGVRAMPTMLAIIQQAGGEFDKLSDAIDGAAATGTYAAEMAETQLDNLYGDWVHFTSALGTTKIMLSEIVNDSLRNFVQQLTELVKKFNDLDEAQKIQILKWGAIVAAIGPVMMILGRLMTTIATLIGIGSKLSSLFTSISSGLAGVTGAAEGVGGGFGSILKAIGNLGTKANWIIAIIMAVITAIIDLWKNSEAFRGWVSDVFKSLVKIVKQVWGYLQQVFGILDGIWMAVVHAIEPIVAVVVKNLSPALEAVWKLLSSILNILMPILEIVGKIIELIITTFVTPLATVIGYILDLLSGFITYIVDRFGALFAFLEDLWSSGLGKAVEWVTWLVDQVVGAFQELKYLLIGDPIVIDLIEGIKAIFQQGLEFVKGVVDWFVNVVVEAFTWLWEKATEVITSLIEGIKELWSELSTWIQELWQTFVEWITEAWNKFSTWIKESLAAIGEHIRQSIDNFHRWLEEVITKIKQTAERILQAIFDTAQRVWNNIVAAFEKAKEHIQDGIEAVKQKFEELKEAIHEKFEEIKEKIQQKFEEIKEKLENLVKMIKEKFDNLLQAIKEHFQKVFEKIKEFGQKFVNAWKEAFKNVQQGIASVFNHIRNGFQQFGSSVVTIAKNVGNAFIKGLLGAGRSIKEFFVNFIKSAVEGLLSSLKAFKQTGELIMKNLWEGIKSKWNEITKLLKELWDSFLEGNLFSTIWDKIKDALSSKTSSVKKAVNGSHADGLAYVPFNGYIAELHKGERVLTAEENQRYSNSSGDGTVINFYSNEKIDEYTAAKELRRTMKDFELGLI